MIKTKRNKSRVAYFFYLLVTTFFCAEIIVRSASNWIPIDLVEYLSPKALASLLDERGQVEDKNPPVYHYRPFQKMTLDPQVIIDENGYRNSEFYQTDVEIVFNVCNL